MFEETALDDEAAQKYFSAANSVEKLDDSERLVLLWAEDLANLENPSFDNLPQYDFISGGAVVCECRTEPPRSDPEHEKRKAKNFRAFAIVNHVFREFYFAICEGDKRYEKEVKEIGKNRTLLVGAIAGHLAPTLNAELVILAAIGAAILRLVIKAGVRALCEFGKHRYF